MRQVRNWLVVLAIVLFSIGTAAFAFAQQADMMQKDQVSVDLSNIRNQIARDINVDVSSIPATVQAPVEVAANVCNIESSVLSEQTTRGAASCTALNSSSALNQIVQSELSK